MTSKDYIILYLIFYMYERVRILNMDYRLVGAELFQKYQYKLCEKLGEVAVASFELTLKKAVDILEENIVDTEVPVNIYMENSRDRGTTMVWIKAKDLGEELDEGEYEEGVIPENEDEEEGEDSEEGDEEGDEEEGSESPSEFSDEVGERPTKKPKMI